MFLYLCVFRFLGVFWGRTRDTLHVFRISELEYFIKIKYNNIIKYYNIIKVIKCYNKIIKYYSKIIQNYDMIKIVKFIKIY